ncbi:hypothetical protein [Acinetobacter tandoii]
MKKIEVGDDVELLQSFRKFKVHEICGDQVICEFRGDDGCVGLVTFPKNMLAPTEVNFLDLL